MEPVIERLNRTIDNLLNDLDQYLVEGEIERALGNRSNSYYQSLYKSISVMSKKLVELKYDRPFQTVSLNNIMGVIYSIKKLMDEDDIHAFNRELEVAYNASCPTLKSDDEKRISILADAYSKMPNELKERVVKNDTRHDGLDFLVRRYVNTKYDYRAVKPEYRPAVIDPLYEQLIDECTRIIKARQTKTPVKVEYRNFKECIWNVARSEVVIRELKKLNFLCNDRNYLGISTLAANLIIKYQKMYEENKEKYREDVGRLGINMVNNNLNTVQTGSGRGHK